METTTEVTEPTTDIYYTALVENTRSIQTAVQHNELLLESINTYMQMALVLVVGVLLYKFITAFTGT